MRQSLLNHCQTHAETITTSGTMVILPTAAKTTKMKSQLLVMDSNQEVSARPASSLGKGHGPSCRHQGAGWVGMHPSRMAVRLMFRDQRRAVRGPAASTRASRRHLTKMQSSIACLCVARARSRTPRWIAVMTHTINAQGAPGVYSVSCARSALEYVHTREKIAPIWSFELSAALDLVTLFPL